MSEARIDKEWNTSVARQEVLHKKRAGVLSGLPMSRQLCDKAGENIHVSPVWGTDRNLTGSPSRPTEFYNLFRHLVVAHIHSSVEWSEHDSTPADTSDRGLDRRVRHVQVWAVCPTLSRWIQLQWTQGLKAMRLARGRVFCGWNCCLSS